MYKKAPAKTYVKRSANSSKMMVVKRREQQEADRVELQVFQIVDLFVRDSSLGVFDHRLKFLELFKSGLQFKYEMLQRNQMVSETKLINLQFYEAD